MEWWSFFRTVRKIGFGIVSFFSLVWAIVLSVYAARAWPHAIQSQRAIVLVMIGVYVYTSVTLYLMIVVLFRLWADFRRTLILAAMHLAIAVPFTIFESRFACTAFNSEGTCQSTYTFALFVTWAIFVIFILHSIYLAVMSLGPPPPPDVISPHSNTFPEKSMDDVEKSPQVDAISPLPVITQAERGQVVSASLVVMGGSVRPAYATRATSQFLRTRADSPTLTDTTDALPTLPYGASSMDGFIDRSASPAPSYSSTDPILLRKPPTRRTRPLLLNRYVVDPVLRQGTPPTPLSGVSWGSRDSTYSYAADMPLARPQQAVIAGHVRSSSLLASAVPPQLRPGTPVSLHRTNSDSSTSSDEPALSQFTARVPLGRRVGTPTSIRSFAPSLLFMDGNENRARTPSPAPAGAGDISKRTVGSSALSRQPTSKLKLPNPYDDGDDEAANAMTDVSLGDR